MLAKFIVFALPTEVKVYTRFVKNRVSEISTTVFVIFRWWLALRNRVYPKAAADD